MEEDIEFCIKDKKFKFRVNGILINKGKVLTVQINNNGFYCLPGGHVSITENSKDAVQREFFEETGIPVKVVNMTALVENLFVRKNETKIHELSIYYLLESTKEYKTKLEYNITEDDHGEQVDLHFKWIDLSEMEKYNFRPNILINKLKDVNNLTHFDHYIVM